MILVVLFFCIFLLFYFWMMFPVAVFILAKMLPRKRRVDAASSKKVKVSVLIACLNESEAVLARIADIFQSDYPTDRIEVVVISDGSTDGTADVARTYCAEDRVVVVVENSEKSGRAIAHNNGVKAATGEILIFTDAGTRFAKNFISDIVTAFDDPKTGFATGVLTYNNTDENAITQSVGLYWRYEQALRRWESEAGLNAFGSGACCAVRAELYQTIPATGDVDFTTPLDVCLQNHCCVHIDSALAYDEMPSSEANELKARIRMTSKNFLGTFGRWGIRGMLHQPALTWVIFSHKYGRWLTPWLLILTLSCSLLVAVFNSSVSILLLVILQVAFYLLGVLGRYKVPIPLASSTYSFLLANYGMFLGVLKVLRNDVSASYVPIRNETPSK